MQRRKLALWFGPTMAILAAVAAMTAATAIAKAPVLTLFNTAGPVRTTTNFTLHIPEIELTSTEGDVKCGEATITGEDLTNSAKSDSAQLFKVGGSLTGAGSCTSNIYKLGTAAYVVMEPESPGSLGALYLTAKARTEIKFHGRVAIGVYFPATSTICSYTVKALKGGLGGLGEGRPLYLEPFGKLKFDKGGSSASCPRQVSMGFYDNVKITNEEGGGPSPWAGRLE